MAGPKKESDKPLESAGQAEKLLAAQIHTDNQHAAETGEKHKSEDHPTPIETTKQEHSAADQSAIKQTAEAQGNILNSYIF